MWMKWSISLRNCLTVRIYIDYAVFDVNVSNIPLYILQEETTCLWMIFSSLYSFKSITHHWVIGCFVYFSHPIISFRFAYFRNLNVFTREALNIKQWRCSQSLPFELYRKAQQYWNRLRANLLNLCKNHHLIALMNNLKWNLQFLFVSEWKTGDWHVHLRSIANRPCIE